MPIVDLEALLAPISAEQPAGEDLRADSSPTALYFQLKDARSTARAAERGYSEDDDGGDSLLPSWRFILETAPKALATRGKDLEITAWYIEALLRAHGFAGLGEGFKLAAGLVENFWDGLYPEPDEDGISTRVKPLSGLNGEGADGTLVQPMRMVPLTGGEPAYALWHYEQACDLVKIAEQPKRDARIRAGAIELATFETAMRQTPLSQIQKILADIQMALDEFARLGALLDEKAGRDSPPASNIRSLLQAAADCVRFAAADRLAGAAAAAADAAAASDPGAIGQAGNAVAVGGGGGVAVSTGKVASRDDAFKTILAVAKFFRDTEPHSPISYTLEELVRRGRMSLPDLLAELLPEEDIRKRFFLAAGARLGGEGEG